MFILRHPQHAAVGVDNGGGQDVVAREAVPAAQQAVSTAEAVSGDSDGRALAAGRCVAVCQSSLALGVDIEIGDLVDVAPATACPGDHGDAARIESHLFHAADVDHDATLD